MEESKAPENLDIFSLAFHQRKKINTEKLNCFFNGRQASLLQRRRILLLIQQTLYQKIEGMHQTLKQFMRFCEEIVSWYNLVEKHIKKMDLDKKAKQQCEYEVFQFAISKLHEFSSQQGEQIQGLTNWLLKTVLVSLKAAFEGFKESARILRKQVEALFESADSARYDEAQQYKKLQQSSDLLENEIYFMQKIQNTDRCHVFWGQKLYKNWKGLLKQQAEIRQSLKNHSLEYNRRHCKIFNSTDANSKIQEFWVKMSEQPEIKTVFLSFLAERDIDFISFGSKKHSFYDKLQDFIKLAHQSQRVGSMLQLIQILQSKYFKCKVQKDKKEWIQTKLYFSLDQNILIFDEDKRRLLLKISSKTAKARKLTENLIELKGKEIGMIFDSSKKQVLHFKSMDEVQELIFYIDNIMTENNPREEK